MIISPKRYFYDEINYLRQTAKERPSLLIIDTSPQLPIYINKIIEDFSLLEWPVEVIKPDNDKNLTSLCEEKDYDSIFINLPLEKNFFTNPKKLVAPDKDCDGIGLEPLVWSCAARGIFEYFKTNKIKLEGKKVLILGRGRAGRAIAEAMITNGATIIQCHSKTPKKIEMEYLKTSDIIISAVGKPYFLRREYCNPGAIVLDLGNNRKNTGELVGDFKEYDKMCGTGWATPVPNGMGLLMRLGLIKNCLTLKRYTNSLDKGELDFGRYF